MKKVLSVLLAVIMAFSVLAVAAGAVGGDYQTYHIYYNIGSEQLHIVPLDGYTNYVLEGQDFKFIIEADDGYDTTFTVATQEGETLTPDVHGIYTISDIKADTIVNLLLVTTNGGSNMFGSLIVLIHDVFAWFKNIIMSIINSNRT